MDEFIRMELERNKNDHDSLMKELSTLREMIHHTHIETIKNINENKLDLTEIKAKVAIFGALFGALPMLALEIVQFFYKK